MNQLSILQVNGNDLRGGAARVAWNLQRAYRDRGHLSSMGVALKLSDDPDVFEIPNHEMRSSWYRACHRGQRALRSMNRRIPGTWRLGEVAGIMAAPHETVQTALGIENFTAPGTKELLRIAPHRTDVLHCHVLHGGYFDLRCLPALSHSVPTVMTLHDAWLLSGHCAHSFKCDRWKTGCGQCPDLTIPPAVQRDATAYNWRRKRDLFRRSRLHVTTPSRWLMEKVQQSMLMEGVMDYRVIPNGVDTSVFRSVSRENVRRKLGLPQERKILLFAANGIRRKRWKDYDTLIAAIHKLAQKRDDRILFLALGEDAEPEVIGGAVVKFIPFQDDIARVAQYFQAADLYVHAARADTFPNAVIEALACGTPVIATSTGGIPEQVKALSSRHSDLNSYGPGNATGCLVPQGDSEALAIAIEDVLFDTALSEQLASNAAHDARVRFSLDGQASAFLTWFQEIASEKRRQVCGSIWRRPDTTGMY